MRDIIEKSISRGILKKIVFSSPRDPSVRRAEARLFSSEKGKFLQIETFTGDGKALHVNLDPSEGASRAVELAERDFRRTSIITTAGECQIMVSKKGKTTVLNRIKNNVESSAPPKVVPMAHNSRRNYIIREGEPCDFLYRLGVCDVNGTVFDKKRAKFRQINRFLEIVRDLFPEKPAHTLYVLDLCCGKSYLSFALYYYLCDILGAQVEMVGADLKSDVIEYCSRVATDCGFNGLRFVCCDISTFIPERAPDLVVSLHACDTATDIVLATAVRTGASNILSSPCCQHEMARQLAHSDQELGFILEKPLFRERFAAMATDALRVLRLEAEGYKVDAIEFIDPDYTPKNLLIRAEKRAAPRKGAREEYDAACKRLGVTPKLASLLNNNNNKG